MNRILLLLVCTMSIFSVSAESDFVENGLAYTVLKDGTLKITNRSFSINWIRIHPTLFYKGDIVIPSTVTHDGKVYKVTEIGRDAFRGCRELKSLVIPEGIRKIDFNAICFVDIKSLHIPSTVRELVPGFVFECPDLAKITVSPNNKYYRSEGNCIYTKDMKTLILVSPMLKTYNIPSSVTTAVDFAFNFSTIKKLVLPSTLKYIGGKTFYPNEIRTIVCKNKLKKIPGSRRDSYDELPRWATVPENCYNDRDLFEKDKEGNQIRIFFFNLSDPS